MFLYSIEDFPPNAASIALELVPTQHFKPKAASLFPKKNAAKSQFRKQRSTVSEFMQDLKLV